MLTGIVGEIKGSFDEIENISEGGENVYGEPSIRFNQLSLDDDISSQSGYVDIYEVNTVEAVHVDEIGNTWLEKEKKHEFEQKVDYYLIPEELVIIEADNYREAANIIADTIRTVVKRVQFDFSSIIESDEIELVSAGIYDEKDGTYSRIHGKHIDFDTIDPGDIVNATVNIESELTNMTLQINEDGHIRSESLHQSWLNYMYDIKRLVNNHSA